MDLFKELLKVEDPVKKRAFLAVFVKRIRRSFIKI